MIFSAKARTFLIIFFFCCVNIGLARSFWEKIYEKSLGKSNRIFQERKIRLGNKNWLRPDKNKNDNIYYRGMAEPVTPNPCEESTTVLTNKQKCSFPPFFTTCAPTTTLLTTLAPITTTTTAEKPTTCQKCCHMYYPTYPTCRVKCPAKEKVSSCSSPTPEPCSDTAKTISLFVVNTSASASSCENCTNPPTNLEAIVPSSLCLDQLISVPTISTKATDCKQGADESVTPNSYSSSFTVIPSDDKKIQSVVVGVQIQYKPENNASNTNGCEKAKEEHGFDLGCPTTLITPKPICIDNIATEETCFADLQNVFRSKGKRKNRKFRKKPGSKNVKNSKSTTSKKPLLTSVVLAGSSSHSYVFTLKTTKVTHSITPLSKVSENKMIKSLSASTDFFFLEDYLRRLVSSPASKDLSNSKSNEFSQDKTSNGSIECIKYAPPMIGIQNCSSNPIVQPSMQATKNMIKQIVIIEEILESPTHAVELNPQIYNNTLCSDSKPSKTLAEQKCAVSPKSGFKIDPNICEVILISKGTTISSKIQDSTESCSACLSSSITHTSCSTKESITNEANCHTSDKYLHGGEYKVVFSVVPDLLEKNKHQADTTSSNPPVTTEYSTLVNPTIFLIFRNESIL